MSDLKPLDRQALDWLELLLSGKATSADVAALKRWRAENPDHERAFGLATAMAQFGQTLTLPEIDGLKAPWLARPKTRRMALAGLGAAAVAYSTARPPLGMWPSLAELSSDYRTAKGQQQTVAVAQGVSLQLNTATSVSLQNRDNNPGIRLVAGEVAVNARLPSDRKFVVQSSGSVVMAQNATFDVRLVDGGIRAVCVEGAVSVQHGTGQLALAPGEATICADGGTAPGKPFAVRSSAVTAWRRGELVFYDSPLRDVVAEINRYRSGRIVVVSQELAERRINASFSINQLDHAPENLAHFANGSATKLPGGLVLLA